MPDRFLTCSGIASAGSNPQSGLKLCGPCNRIKSNRLTLSGLRAENAKRGRMAGNG